MPVPVAVQPAEASSGVLPHGPASSALARVRGPARWIPAPWTELPGWSDDRVRETWPALRAGCLRPVPGWSEFCARLLLEPAPDDDTQARQWLATHLQPWRIESADGTRDGLATGYFEPVLDASRRPQGRFTVPLHALPPSWASASPGWTRQQLDTLPQAAAALRGHEIAYVDNALDALLIQIQGSGRLRVLEPDGSVRMVRLAYAGHNGQPYRSVGRWLLDQGELQGEVSWPTIKAWAQRKPERLREAVWSNPRVVFFREEAVADPSQGPRGAMGVPLTPGRSVAVDPRSVPYGTPLWIDTTEPLAVTPLRRLVVAQDTGSAILGAVRVDYFWGWGDDALAQAGRMRQVLRKWALWPRGALPPP